MKQCLHLSIQSPAIEDTVSVPLVKVREFGDQQSISTSVRTPQKFAVNPQCQNSGKKFPSGVTCGDRRAASRPSLQVPCTLPQSHLRSGVGVLWPCWQIAPCLNGCSLPFAHGFHSLALMSVFWNVIFLPFILNSPSPS